MSPSVTRRTATANLGLEVTGYAGRDLVEKRAADELRDALASYGVVVYRDLHIADDDLVALSRLLGDVVTVATGESEHPEIQVISLDPEKADKWLARYRRGNFLWHIDGAHDPVPQQATLLAAQAVDDADDGDTEFASTYAAYDSLADDVKQEIADLLVVHSFATAQAKSIPEASDKERAQWDRVEPRVHPLVWEHRDGRRSLLLGSTAREIVGWEPERGRALLDRLLVWSTQPEFVLRHHWRVGDLVVWDNTGMLHRALPFAYTSSRRLHRTTLRGEDQVAAR